MRRTRDWIGQIAPDSQCGSAWIAAMELGSPRCLRQLLAPQSQYLPKAPPISVWTTTIRAGSVIAAAGPENDRRRIC